DPDCLGLTVGEILRHLDRDNGSKLLTLRAALEELAPPKAGRFNAKSIGRRLMHFRLRNCGGRGFDSHPDRSGALAWRIVPIKSAGFAGFEGFEMLDCQAQEKSDHTVCGGNPVLGPGNLNPSNHSNPAVAFQEGVI
ncbi:MAG: hypothetical protein JWN70_2258, partial [Planctomycetaceae bacterium]|nr:hypothetical protein [Planctomycetaceae bacterium]